MSSNNLFMNKTPAKKSKPTPRTSNSQGKVAPLPLHGFAELTDQEVIQLAAAAINKRGRLDEVAGCFVPSEGRLEWNPLTSKEDNHELYKKLEMRISGTVKSLQLISPLIEAPLRYDGFNEDENPVEGMMQAVATFAARIGYAKLCAVLSAEFGQDNVQWPKTFRETVEKLLLLLD
jgi:hypothetical protein